ncbi:MAG TPA: CDP-diacylglycerol--glycerol-3-phosphate 3-phosphatidyltransferase [Gammaproteobacteria bacterium]|nr:CDP-diacylglycerol--glycerol-3-phosphate 3-phosphatidyltransferase [Gammaproteobacteria bacterium]
MHLNIPTILTLSRIAIIPFFVLFYYLPIKESNLICTVLFVVAGITDWLDGFIARRFNMMSRFGAFLDPVADKLTVAVVLILLVDRNPTPYPDLLMAIPAAIIIGREITISALREWMAEIGEGTKVAVSWVGKVKTAAQLVALPMMIYREPLFGNIPVAEIGFYLLYLSAALTLWSMYTYLKCAWPALKRSANDS